MKSLSVIFNRTSLLIISFYFTKREKITCIFLKIDIKLQINIQYIGQSNGGWVRKRRLLGLLFVYTLKKAIKIMFTLKKLICIIIVKKKV